MEVKLSQTEIQQIAAEVAKVLKSGGGAPAAAKPGRRGRPPKALAAKAPAAKAPTGAKRGPQPGMSPEEAVKMFPELTVRTIKRGITEGRIQPRRPGGQTVTRGELQRFLDSRK
jgi:hypothetical protein